MGEVIHLFRGNDSADSDAVMGSAPVEVRGVAVQFLSRGRNAWHSTWIRRYQVGDFFRDGRTLREAVFKRKTRGTVFYLAVLPALELRFGDRRFILTEINTREPFRYMDPLHARYSFHGRTLEDVLEVIRPPSPLWKKAQSLSDALILQEVREPYIDLAAYEAMSVGYGSHINPPLGEYQRSIHGSSGGVSEWHWEGVSYAGKQKFTARYFRSALGAVVEGIESERYFVAKRVKK